MEEITKGRCFKCQDNHVIENGVLNVTKNKRFQLRGTCQNCKTPVTTFVKGKPNAEASPIPDPSEAEGKSPQLDSRP